MTFRTAKIPLAIGFASLLALSSAHQVEGENVHHPKRVRIYCSQHEVRAFDG